MTNSGSGNGQKSESPDTTVSGGKAVSAPPAEPANASSTDSDHEHVATATDDMDLEKWLQDALRESVKNKVPRRHIGFTFSKLNVNGSDASLGVQSTVASAALAPFKALASLVQSNKGSSVPILKDCHGYLEDGQMLLVLGRPGSGCSTFLKTMAGRTQGLSLGGESVIEYNGIPASVMKKQFTGEVLYNDEVDKHFPILTVSQTLKFASSARIPNNLPPGVTRSDYIARTVDAALTVFRLRQAENTRVGDDFIRGVSGGERKRVSIAEMALSRAPLSLWDNSTRGLDAGTALDFVTCLRTAADITLSSSVVSIYQASQAIFDCFDLVMVLYQGKQIFYGPQSRAKSYFEEMGYMCPERMTTGDFLTSVTNPKERRTRPGLDLTVPKTADDFHLYWTRSTDYTLVIDRIGELRTAPDSPHPERTAASQFELSRQTEKARGVRPKSPYTISFTAQVLLCTRRAFQRIWNDVSSTATTVLGTMVMALIIGSVFYGTPQSTGALFQKGGILFFAILINALNAVSEISALYAKRPIINKQASYALCHPAAEAIAGIVADVPIKLAVAICFNLILYFLGGLRMEPGPFFVFFLFSLVINFTMSFVFKTIGALTRSVSQAMTAAGVLVLAIIIYTGFTIPRPDMRPWFQWLSWINPVAFAFEALLVNELHDQQYQCSALVPGQGVSGSSTFICASRGAVEGENTVSGDAFLRSSYQYSYDHLWRNLGIILAFLLVFMTAYVLSSEWNAHTDNSAQMLIYKRSQSSSSRPGRHSVDDIESGQRNTNAVLSSSDSNTKEHISTGTPPRPRSTLNWRDLNYDITLAGGETRRLLSGVDGWVKPGTLTALMGSSGAGKTTLLDVLAQRSTTGIVTGDIKIDNRPLNDSFQRKTGYVQQQDLHLETTSVREALHFSALLRLPASTPKSKKIDHAEEVIKMLDIGAYAEAIVGVAGEGLNVEQRKMLSIGVELAAKPDLLIFLDEPTSGLDSQSAWAIMSLLRRLADQGTAILCTIHQPSSVLFQEFDRLLLLARGGKTVYFGDIGPNSEALIGYFTAKGAPACPTDGNPAEWMLDILNGPSIDWPQEWHKSTAYKSVQDELARLHGPKQLGSSPDEDNVDTEFAMPLWEQVRYTTIRVFQQYWRTPEYLWAKLLLGTLSALFIGFSFFKSDSSQQGMQNIMFSIFMLTTIFTTLVQQIMPRFVTQRSLYEVRERPSKVYSWKAFLVANIVVELPWQFVLSVLVFVCYYYPLGFWQYADPQFNERGGLMFLYILAFFVFASTFAQMIIAPLADEGAAGAIASMLFSLTLTFNGVLQGPEALPGFWIFMYRVSPLTYLVSGMLSTALHGRSVQCAANELSMFDAQQGQTCGEYLETYLRSAPGQLLNPLATQDCRYCPLSTADQFLVSVSASWDNRWRDFGLLWAYICFNIMMTFVFYWWFRVRTWTVGGNVKKAIARLSRHREEKKAGMQEEEDSEEGDKFRLMKSVSRKMEVQPRAY